MASLRARNRQRIGDHCPPRSSAQGENMYENEAVAPVRPLLSMSTLVGCTSGIHGRILADEFLGLSHQRRALIRVSGAFGLVQQRR